MREDRPSSTAILIAAATVFLSRDRLVRGLVPVDAARWCALCLDALGLLAVVRALSHPALRWVGRLAERATIPGLLLHFMVRKRWIESAVRAALAAKHEQVVVVGAGFDTLALRLAPEVPAVRFVEIDHPATQAVKTVAAARGGGAANVHFTAADLARVPLGEALARAAAYRADAATTWIVEGLLMYLTDAQVSALFDAVASTQRGPARVVFTVMEPTADGRSAFHNATPLVRRLLARWSEPFRSSLRREDAPAFLERHGFRVLDVADAGILCRLYLAPAGLARLALARGEIVIVAERAAA